MAFQWYVLRVPSGREDAVRQNLEERIRANKMESQVRRLIIPSEKVSEIKGRRRQIAEKKLYPGYLMVEMEMSDEAWFLVRDTPGIGDFVGGGTRPVPMKEHEAAKMLGLMEQREEQPKLRIDFKVGDSVKIKDGPFENFDGTVEEINPSKGLVRVVVMIFGRVTPVELEYWQVEPL